MKVVINVCHGGFSLSPKAVELYSKKKNKKCYFFTLKKGEYIPVDGYPDGTFIWYAAATEKLTDENYNETIIDAHFYYNRNDPILIEVVEQLGAEADGDFAKLKIVEIPDDVKWHIDEYDGLETIHEDHRTWS